jgi:hypothetical protein
MSNPFDGIKAMTLTTPGIDTLLIMRPQQARIRGMSQLIEVSAQSVSFSGETR